ncbi:putative monooxygenase-like protein [Rosellinia necatrix]|uniref:Putative monooxygenase-like protein n=1 Tax=Rosellinia necatrix TaxID=77044 RepID=A0A1S7UKJ5_ROSNE|nr:putative monooxygenase-like protein [Rosellinia necatrix]
MDTTTEVIIVGAGPAGLALAINLSKFKVKSIILEKELEITEDPRGVAITHDAVRICWDLGLSGDMDKIGHELPHFNFHKASFANAPFLSFDASSDSFAQTVPGAIFQIQPMLESAMREKLVNSQYCELRSGCTVTGRKQDGINITAEYTDAKGQLRTVRGSWLIGADGKRGIVRKHFLEPTAGIRQVDSSYKYDGTWIAANLELSLPTPKTHPDFPLWKLGYTPNDVYDLFWPVGWHFGSPPGKPLAAGRFGPYEARLWRHEFAQNDWNDAMDAEELLWENLTPMITRKYETGAGIVSSGEVMYPRDCIKIRRCRPFHFTHKVVNKWFNDRTILIGDAAHVFPPFGGQGIASGLRDAQQLAWRLMLLQRLPNINRSICDKMLQAWAEERTHSVKQAASLTSLNGQLCNYGDSWKLWLLRNIDWAMRQVPFFRGLPEPLAQGEAHGFMDVDEGFFSSHHKGGGRLPQVYLSTRMTGPVLSDSVLRPLNTAMTLLVIAGDDPSQDMAEARRALDDVQIDRAILSPDAIKIICSKPYIDAVVNLEVYYPTTMEQLSEASDVSIRALYAPSNLFSRFNPLTKFIILRSDFFTFGLAENYAELVECIIHLKHRIGYDVS